ncbi:polyhydroxyalkanoate biosynthesis repressor PhaR [Bacillus sp. BRMEA1]|uniref:polyhydroxyalkanoate biosynthesis repressor PhaR n=1 Tax=Neobacillus endophyticus TaxID=2738405 RepID=UPI001565AEA8|nr:polyhydroxyalkanoate biosynthesis repressor PhaR [Neobacillus endophyticus]NRD78625.1 polyhydroxyalkanoate biosynthesis repressor PhaR [Neobacillus endophyticus]
MSDNKTYDPFETLHKFSLLWEKQINDFIYLWTNNSEFIKFSNIGTEIQSRYIDTFKKNHEALAGVLNLPTKSDVTNVANLTIQAEEKVEALEEQIWELQDSVKAQSKEIESVVEVSKEIIKLTKQLKTELMKTKKELADTKDLHAELQEMKFELMKLNNFKEEFELLKDLIEKDKTPEPVLSSASSAK